MNLRFCFITAKWPVLGTVTFASTLFVTDRDLSLSQQGIISRCHAKFISRTEPSL